MKGAKMGNSGEKYARFCQKSGTQFEGRKLSVGAIYGRIGTTRFICSDLTREHRKLSVLVKRGVCDWKIEKIPVTSDICELIEACAAEKQAKNPPKQAKIAAKPPHPGMERIIYQGVAYWAYPNEFYLGDFEPPDELRGIAPQMRKTAPFDAKHMKPDNCREDGKMQIQNESSFWAIFKDMDRRCEWSDTYQRYV